MASSRNHDARAAPPGRARTRRFSPDALARVLSAELELTPEVPLYVAFSGGMDSHVLLHAAVALRARAPWRVAALHVDHGLQPESGAWARHCASVCAALGVPFQSERVAVRGVAERGLEDAARRARYAALGRLLPAGAVLLTAHHLNDQAETVLLQLLRGSGVAGLAAMGAIVPFAHGRLARPLLGFERAALADYARAAGLAWVEDASNLDTGPARNYLRAAVWPALVAAGLLWTVRPYVPDNLPGVGLASIAAGLVYLALFVGVAISRDDRAFYWDKARQLVRRGPRTTASPAEA
jgi:tRNA(Ile)-lysidine synthase